MQNDPLWGPLFRPNRNPTSNAGQPIFNGPGGTASDLSPRRRWRRPAICRSGVVSRLQPDARLRSSWQRPCLRRQQPGHGTDALGCERSDLLDASLQHRSHLGELEQRRPHQSQHHRQWLEQDFIFAGPDGKEVKAVVKDYTNTKKCDYTYDALLSSPIHIACGRDAIARAAAAAAAAPVTLAKSQSGRLPCSAAPVKVNLQGAASPRRRAPRAGVALVRQAFGAAGRPQALSRPQRLQGGRASRKRYIGSISICPTMARRPIPSTATMSDRSISSPRFPMATIMTTQISPDVQLRYHRFAANLDAKGLLKAEHCGDDRSVQEPAANAKPVVGDISFVEQ